MDALPGLWSLSPIGFGLGVVAWHYIRMSTGNLYSRKQHLEMMAASEKRGDEWKETALDQRVTIKELQSRSVILPTTEAAEQLLEGQG